MVLQSFKPREVGASTDYNAIRSARLVEVSAGRNNTSIRVGDSVKMKNALRDI